MRTPTGIEAAVCDDIASRQEKGVAKYGTTVADNPLSLREWLQHAYEETLDKAVYLKRAIAEIDSRWVKGASIAPPSTSTPLPPEPSTGEPIPLVAFYTDSP